MEIGVDIGGTFTDLVALEPATGAITMAKVPTTVDDQSKGFIAALTGAAIDVPALAAAVHGTTVAVNALIERKGCAAGLITSQGFRDVLELRRRDRPSAYGLKATFVPLIPRHRRVEIPVCLDAAGRVLSDVSEDELAGTMAKLKQAGTEAIVISLFNGYQNAAKEQELAQRLIALGWPADRLTVATAVSQEAREFERTSTAAINTYVQPVMANYLTRLADGLAGTGFARDLLVAQSNGGAVHWSESARLPVNSILSGPAAGVIAAARIAKDAGYTKALSCDIGGTSCDISLIDGGLPSMRAQSELEFGLPIWRPMVDVRSIGAGGGSIASIDRGGILRVGPRSAGAHPGPACYGLGGDEATVTDAHLVLGRFAQGMALGTGGGLGLDRAKAIAAIEGRVAKPLGLSLEDAAEAVISVAEQRIAAAMRRISTERGHDPRDFILVLFGGAGAAHACSLMRELSLAACLVPPYPGATSALGCLLCDLRQDFVRTVNLPLDDRSIASALEIWRSQRSEGLARVTTAGAELAGMEELFSLSCCYQGQAHSIEVPIADFAIGPDALEAEFTRQYRRRYSTTLSDFPIIVTAVRTTVRGVRPTRKLAPPVHAAGPPRDRRAVRCAGTWHETAVTTRQALSSGAVVSGPLIVEQADTTIWIEPGFTARTLAHGALLIETAR